MKAISALKFDSILPFFRGIIFQVVSVVFLNITPQFFPCVIIVGIKVNFNIKTLLCQRKNGHLNCARTFKLCQRLYVISPHIQESRMGNVAEES